MKQQVRLSRFSLFMTIATSLLLIGIMVICLNNTNDDRSWFFAILIVIICFTSLFYTPLSISVDNEALYVNRSLKCKKIKLEDISHIGLYTRSPLCAHRIMGSGGFCGYWGLFSESGLGRYFAYYGKTSDCFLVRLKNGRQYMLGCQNPQEIVNFVQERIKSRE